MSDLKYVIAVRKGQYDLPGNGTAVDVKPGTIFQVPAALKVGINSWLRECDKNGEATDPAHIQEKAKDLRSKATAKKEAVAIAESEWKIADAKASEAEKRAADAVKGELKDAKPEPVEPGANPNKDLVPAKDAKPAVHTAANPVQFPKK